MKYFIKIYGCQYNEWDGARLDYLLQKLGLTPSGEKEADIIFLLSCSVRKSAVDRVMGLVKNNSHKKVVVTGCILNNDKKKYKEKNVIIWDNQKPEDLKDILLSFRPIASPPLGGSSKARNPITTRSLDSFQLLEMTKMLNKGNASSAYLPIMIGCNNFCSYCAVPYTRGRETSRPFDEVVTDFKKMVRNGHKGIMLLGQNVNSYNPSDVISTHREPTAGWIERGEKSQHSKNKFSLLLKTLNDINGNFTITFTSNHPKDMSEEVIKAIASLPKIKKEIHLPLQSGSNKILKAMNRPYTKEKYLELVDEIKKAIPNVSITTDFIVGFPGETEEDFQETVELIKKVNYKAAYINKYSPRSGTVAYKLGDPIPWKEKERRWRILNDISYTSKRK